MFCNYRREKPLVSVNDFINKNWLWYAESPTWAFALRGSTRSDVQKLLENSRYYNKTILRNLISTIKTAGFGVVKLPSGSYAFSDYFTPDVLESHIVRVHLFDIYVLFINVIIYYRSLKKNYIQHT